MRKPLDPPEGADEASHLVLRDRARRARRPIELPSRGRPVLTFRMGDERFGLPAERVCEILPVPKVTRVPGAPSSLRGVANLRGRLLVIVDTACLLGLAEGEGERLLLVVEHRERRRGLEVQGPVGLASIEAPPGPGGSDGIRPGLVQEAGIVGILDLEVLLGALAESGEEDRR